MTALSFTDYIAANAPARYGLHVLELGEDGGTLVVLGHHSDRRTLAALNHYARTVWGCPLNSEPFGAPAPDVDDVSRCRGIVVHACERGWSADEPIPTADLELADPATTCPDCERVGSTWALLYRPDAQDHPAAFPITVWEYDV